MKDSNASPYLPEGTYFSDVVPMQGYQKAKLELASAIVYSNRGYDIYGNVDNEYNGYPCIKRWITAMATIIRWQRQLIKQQEGIKAAEKGFKEALRLL